MLRENPAAPMIHDAQKGAPVARIGAPLADGNNARNNARNNRLILDALPGLHSISRTFPIPLPPGIDSEDLVSEAALAMASHLARGLPWSKARARGAMSDLLRRSSGSRRGEMPADVEDAKAGPEELVIRTEQRRIVQRNAASLPAREQALLRLASSGASGQRIAQELRVGTRRARRLKAGAVARLAGALAA